MLIYRVHRRAWSRQDAGRHATGPQHAIPPSFGGVGGRSAYIDSEGSFLAPRCLQMAEALVRFLHAAATTDQQRADANALQPRAMLDAILVYRVHDALEQLAAIRAASEVQREEAAEAAKRARAAQFAGAPPASSSSACLPPLKLVVVDSIAFHLRHSEATYTAKQQLQGKMAQSLCSLALHGTDGSGLAVVVINQVTTKVNDAIGSSSLVRSGRKLGARNVQLMLAWRTACASQSLRRPAGAVYVVSAEGVRSRDAPPPPSVAGKGRRHRNRRCSDRSRRTRAGSVRQRRRVWHNTRHRPLCATQTATNRPTTSTATRKTRPEAELAKPCSSCVTRSVAGETLHGTEEWAHEGARACQEERGIRVMAYVYF